MVVASEKLWRQLRTSLSVLSMCQKGFLGQVRYLDLHDLQLMLKCMDP